MPWMNACDYILQVEESREKRLGPLNPRERTTIPDPERWGEVGVPIGVCVDCGGPTSVKRSNAFRCRECHKVWRKEQKRRWEEGHKEQIKAARQRR
jgi:hypothetical protein